MLLNFYFCLKTPHPAVSFQKKDVNNFLIPRALLFEKFGPAHFLSKEKLVYLCFVAPYIVT